MAEHGINRVMLTSFLFRQAQPLMLSVFFLCNALHVQGGGHMVVSAPGVLGNQAKQRDGKDRNMGWEVDNSRVV